MIQEIEKNKYFKEKILEVWEILFNEWDFDRNIYIVSEGKLVVEKYLSKETKEKKVLAFLERENIFWEWNLNNSNPKEVTISALEKSKIYFIEIENFKDFLKEYLDLAITFLKEIIDLSNKRLLNTNFLLTSTYKISQMISETENFSNKNFFKIIDEFQKIINSKYIIYAEVNQALDNYVNILYDSRNIWKMENKIFETYNFKNNFSKFSELNLIEKNEIIELKNTNKVIWYLIIWDEKNFWDSEKQVINSIWVLLAWFIKQKQFFQNEKDKEF